MSADEMAPPLTSLGRCPNANKNCHDNSLKRCKSERWQMFRRMAAPVRKFNRINLNTKISVALARAAATAPLRTIDPKDPRTWEFSGFSQHGEDGIIDYLCSQILNPTRFFFEIGAANGIENC